MSINIYFVDIYFYIIINQPEQNYLGVITTGNSHFRNIHVINNCFNTIFLQAILHRMFKLENFFQKLSSLFCRLVYALLPLN